MDQNQVMAPAAGRRIPGRLDLLVGVALLGLLAAVAIPRQRQVTADTRRTEVAALAASVRSAARFGHALWTARGGPAALSVRRGRVAMVNGYPAAGDLARLLEEPETMAFVEDRGAWRHGGVAPGLRCGVRYAPPPHAGAQPVITVTLDEC